MKIRLLLAYNKKFDRDWVPSLGLGYLTSFVKQNLNNVDIAVENDISKILKDNKIDSVGISCSTQNINIAERYASLIKKQSNAVTVLGGPHITALPYLLPESFDFGVVGEGEQTFLELIQFIKKDFMGKLDEIKGIVYFNEGGDISYTGRREYINNLDSIPIPDRGQLFYSFSTVHMVTSRGCPNHCTFCCSNKLWGKTRYFSIDYVINEIENILFNYKPKIINFFDDVFFRNKKELYDFTKEIKNKGIDKKTTFTCYIRADEIDEEILRLFVEIGIKFIYFGAESGSQDVLNFLKGKGATVKKNQDLLDMTSKFNIGVGATFIKGVPIESKNDLSETYDFIERNVKSNKLKIWKIFNLAPFPGSAMWQYAKRKNIVDEKMDFSKFYHPEKYLYMNEKISKPEFLSICRKRESLLTNN